MKLNKVQNDVERKEKQTRKRAIRDENAPKHPLNAYAFYIKQNAKACKNTADFKGVAGAWRAMTDEQRKPFVDQSSEDRVRYEKQMEEYKKSDAYERFLKDKQSSAKKFKDLTSGENKVNGICIFSKEFLEYNKARESSLRKLRREIGVLEEETETIEKKVSLLTLELEATQETIFTEETQLLKCDKILEKWRISTLKAMENAKLLSHYHLTVNSKMEDLLARLEEASKNHDSFSNLLRSCLSNSNY